MKEEIFICTMAIFLIMNTFYLIIVPTAQNTFINSSVIGIIVSAIALAIASGIKIMGSGLSDTSVKIIFVSIILMNILYKVELYGFTIGMGLSTNIVNIFSGGDILSLGSILINGLSLMALFSGIMIVAEDS